MATAPGKYGAPAPVGSDGEYIAPSEYEGQGTNRVVRNMQFSYTILHTSAAGDESLTSVNVPRDTPVTLEMIGMEAMVSGDRHHAFYTDAELDLKNNTGRDRPVIAGKVKLDELGEFELAEWLKSPHPDTGKAPTVDLIAEAVNGNSDLAHRMLAAENTATEGDPRKSLVNVLRSIIEG